MKSTLYVSTHCPESQEVLRECEKKGLDVRVVDITSNLTSLKEFMRLREKASFFDKAKEEDRVGIPVFVFEDQEVFYDAEEGVDWEWIKEELKK